MANIIIYPATSRIAFTSTNSIVQDIIQTAAGAIVVSGSTGTASFDNGAATFSSSVTANSTAGISGSFVSNTFFGSIDLENTGGTATGKWNLQAVSGAQIGGSAGSSFGIYSYGASAYRMFINSSGNVGIGTISPTYLLDVNGTGRFSGSVDISKSSNSGSGNDYPKLNIKNTLVTQGDGSSTFNFAFLNVSSGNEAVNMFIGTTYAAGTWAPAGIIAVATNHDLQLKTNNTTRLTISSTGEATFSNLAGTGTRMVVADASGVLSTQAIGSGAITGSGTTNYLPKFTGTSTIGNSSASDNGTTFDVAIQGKFTGASGSRILTLNAPTDGGSLTFESGGTAYADIGSNKAILGTGSATNFYLGTRAGSSLIFGTANAACLFLDASGNLGLGVTPSAWSAGSTLDINSKGAIHNSGTVGFLLGWNVYYDAGYKYKANGFARSYVMDDGGHSWNVAGNNTSGAGAAITFTQAMTLFSTGNLAIATTTDAGYKLDVNGTGRFMVSSTSQNQLRVYSSDATATLRTYSTSDGDGLILNQYYAVAGSPYLRSADFVASMGDIASTQMRFFTKAASSNPAVALTIASTGAATFSSSVTAGGDILANGSSIFTKAASGGYQISLNAQASPMKLRFDDLTGAAYGSISFQAGNGTSGFVDRLTIASTGAATFSSSVTATTSFLGRNTFGTAGTNASPVFEDLLTGLNGNNAPAKIQIGNSFASSAGSWLKFVVNSNTAANTPVDVMTLKYDGNVGIGTTSPAYTLDVNGTLRATGAATFSSSVSAGGNLLLGASASTIGALNFVQTGSSPTASRITFGTDGTGYNFAIGKNQGGTITDFLTLADNGPATFSSTIKTAAPTTATAGAMKFGAVQSGSAVTAAGYWTVNIDGTDYYINLLSTSP